MSDGAIRTPARRGATSGPRAAQLLADLIRLAALGATVLVGALLTGLVLQIDPIASAHEATFDPLVSGLQAIPGLVEVSRVVTDLGYANFNILVLYLSSLVVVYRHRLRSVPWLVGLAAAGLLMRPFQGVVARVTDGSVPSSDLVDGVAGPFFSGGVLRVVLVFGLLFAALGTDWVSATRYAGILGVVEGITRLVLGRHWPLDILFAIPLGIGLLLCVRSLIAILDGLFFPDTNNPGHPAETNPV